MAIVKSPEDGIDIAKNTIELYLKYETNIEGATKEIEKVYGVDEKTFDSEWLEDWALLRNSSYLGDSVSRKEFLNGMGAINNYINKYPTEIELLTSLKRDFKLDYLIISAED